MTNWVLRVLSNACALAVAAWLFAGIVVDGASQGDRVLTLMLVALIFGLVNELVRPVVALLSLPLYLLTFGLFYFVVNALMLLLTSWLSDVLNIGFHVDGFWTAVFGALMVTVVGRIIGLAFPSTKSRGWR